MRQQEEKVQSEQSLNFEKKTSNKIEVEKNLITVELWQKKVAKLVTYKADIVYSVFIAH